LGWPKRKVRVCNLEEITYLFAALDNIKGADCGVSETASEDTASHAFSVVTEVVDV